MYRRCLRSGKCKSMEESAGYPVRTTVRVYWKDMDSGLKDKLSGESVSGNCVKHQQLAEKNTIGLMLLDKCWNDEMTFLYSRYPMLEGKKAVQGRSLLVVSRNT